MQLTHTHLTEILGRPFNGGKVAVVFFAIEANSRASRHTLRSIPATKNQSIQVHELSPFKNEGQPYFLPKDLVVLHPSMQPAHVAAVLIADFRQEREGRLLKNRM